jgi:hypothetical protein
MNDTKVHDITYPKYWKRKRELKQNIPYRPPIESPASMIPKGEPWKPAPHPPRKE